MQIKTYDADWLIEQYIFWCRQGEGKGGTILGNLIRGPRMPGTILTDDEALAIDSIMGELSMRMPESYLAAIIYYRTGRNYSTVASVMETNRQRASSLVWIGVAWVDGKLDAVPLLNRLRNRYSELRREMQQESYGEQWKTEKFRLRLIEVLENT